MLFLFSHLSCGGPPSNLRTVPCRGVAEFPLEYRAELDNPFTEVSAEGVFTEPGTGRTIKVDGFYDGDNLWLPAER